MQLLLQASDHVRLAVLTAVDVEKSLIELSQSAPNSADRKALRSLLDECRTSGFEFARGVAAGLLARAVGSELKLVVSAPFATDERQTAGVIAELIGSAKRTVSVCSFVLVYLDELLPLFSSARGQGVKIRVLLDHEATHAKSASRTATSLRAILGPEALRFWGEDHQGETSLHAKFLIVDDEVALITSANMTGRALTQNVEVGCLTSDPAVCLRLSGLFEELWQQRTSNE